MTNGIATPAQPDPQTVLLNAAQSQQRPQEKPLPGTGLPFSQATGPPPAPPQIPQPQEGTPSPRAPLSPGGTADSSPIQPQQKKMLFPGAGMSTLSPPEIPRPATASPSESPPNAPLSPAPPCTATPHTASSHRPDHSLWPTEDVLFCPNDALPAFVTGIPALSSGPELWIAVHNHRPKPLQLHLVQNIGVLEVVTLADSTLTHLLSSSNTVPSTTTRAFLAAPAAAAK